MSPDEYAKLSKLAADRENAWREQARGSHPAMFTRLRWTIYTAIFAALLVAAVVCEGWERIMG